APVISSIRALPAAPFSRRSSSVWSGTHSSLKAIRYSAISSSSAHRQPGRLPLTFSTNALTLIRHPGRDCFQAFRVEAGRTLRNVGFPPQRCVRYDRSWYRRQRLVHSGLMEIRHRESIPSVHPEAYVAPTAVLSGQVRVGPGSCVLHGAVLSADGGPVD